MEKKKLKERFFERFFYAEDSSRDWDRWRKQDPSVVLDFIEEELDKAREEGKKEILEEIDKLPKYEKNNSIGTVRYVSLSELKSKLTTK